MTSLHLPSHPIHPTPLIPCSDIPPPSFSSYSSYSTHPVFRHPSTFLLTLFILVILSHVHSSLHIPSHPIYPTPLIPCSDIPPHSLSSNSSYFTHPSTFLLILFILLHSSRVQTSLHIPSHPIHPTLLIHPHSFSSYSSYSSHPMFIYPSTFLLIIYPSLLIPPSFLTSFHVPSNILILDFPYHPNCSSFSYICLQYTVHNVQVQDVFEQVNR